jgi:hypothetical protein
MEPTIRSLADHRIIVDLNLVPGDNWRDVEANDTTLAAGGPRLSPFDTLELGESNGRRFVEGKDAILKALCDTAYRTRIRKSPFAE